MTASPTSAGSPHPWRTFGVLAATAALTILDVSKVGVAFPAIQASTGGSPAEVQFMLVGYTIAYALLLLPSGRLGDILPRKTVFLAGAALFVAASLLCALAPTALWLVIGRIVQGAGAGILMPQVLGLIQRGFPADRRTRPLAVLAAIISGASTFGPVIAGAVMQAVGTPDSWRALFWIDVAIGVVVIPIAAWMIREPGGERRRGFDAIGVALLVPGVALTIFPLSTISGDNGPAPWMLASALVGIGCFVGFIAHENRLGRREVQPLVDPRLFRMRHFPAGLAISGMAYAAGTAGTLTVTLVLEEVAHQSALQTALWMLPAAGAMIVGSTITARLPQQRGYPLIAVGTALGAVTLGTIALVIGTLPAAPLPPVLCGLLVVNTFGSSFVGAPNQARALLAVPEYRSSIAGSLIQFAQRVGSAFGLALVLILYNVFRHDIVPWSGRDTLGPTLAIGLTAVFLAIGSLIAIGDGDAVAGRLHRRRPAPELSAELLADETP